MINTLQTLQLSARECWILAKRSWKIVLFYFALALASTGAAWITTAAFDDRSPRDAPFGFAHKSSYEIGETVTGQWNVVVKRDCKGHTIRWLTSSGDRSFVSNLPSEDVFVPAEAGPIPAHITIGIAPFVVPPMPVGIAYYHRVTTYACNWLQRAFPGWFGIEIAYPVIEFYVRDSGVNPKGSGEAPITTAPNGR